MDINQSMMVQQQIRNSLQDKRQAILDAKEELAQKQAPRKQVEELIGAPLTGEALNRILKSKYIKKGFSKIGFSSEDIDNISKIKNKGDLLNFLKKKGYNTLDDMKNDIKSKVNNLIPNIENKVNNVTKQGNIHQERFQKAQDLDERYNNLTTEGKSQVDAATEAYEPIVENSQQDVENNFDNLAGIRENVISKMEDSLETKTIPDLPTITNPGSVFDGLEDSTIPKINNLPSVNSIVSSGENMISKDGLDNIAGRASSLLQSVKSGASDLVQTVKSGASKVGEGLLTGLGEAGSEGFLDPVTDIVGLATGIGSLLDGIFDTKKISPIQGVQQTSSYAAGVL